MRTVLFLFIHCELCSTPAPVKRALEPEAARTLRRRGWCRDEQGKWRCASCSGANHVKRWMLAYGGVGVLLRRVVRGQHHD